MTPFQHAFAEIAEHLRTACEVAVIWKDADPRQWSMWPAHLSQHKNPFCRRVKRSAQRLAICCHADTEMPTHRLSHKRVCPFGVIEQIVPFDLHGRIVGWCFVEVWQDKQDAIKTGVSLEPYPPAKAESAAELTRRLVGGILHLYSGRNAEPDERLRWVHDYIEEHLQADLRASQVAQAMGLSSSRFVHWFKEVEGIPYSEYLSQRVLARAAVEVRAAQRSITAIALDLGFPSPSYFATKFKQYYGDPPSRWRHKVATMGE